MLCIAATSELPGDDHPSHFDDCNCDLGDDCNGNGFVDDDGDVDDDDDDDDQHGRHRGPTIRGRVEIHCEHLGLVPGHR